MEAGISVEYWGSGVVVGLEVESGGNGARGGGEGEGDAEAEGEDVMRSVMVAELDGTATMDGSMALTMRHYDNPPTALTSGATCSECIASKQASKREVEAAESFSR